MLRRQQRRCALKNGASVFREHKEPKQKLGMHDGAAVVMGLDKLAGGILENWGDQSGKSVLNSKGRGTSSYAMSLRSPKMTLTG